MAAKLGAARIERFAFDHLPMISMLAELQRVLEAFVEKLGGQ